jgi:hypothetical protein
VQKTNKDVVITLADWCRKNKYPGVTKECVLSAFNSNDPDVQALAKREKLKGMINDE